MESSREMKSRDWGAEGWGENFDAVTGAMLGTGERAWKCSLREKNRHGQEKGWRHTSAQPRKHCSITRHRKYPINTKF